MEEKVIKYLKLYGIKEVREIIYKDLNDIYREKYKGILDSSLSNKEKAICLHVFMEMYSCHRRCSIDRNKQKNDHISIWLEDYLGKEKAEEILSIIEKKHENEVNILESWIS